MYTTAPTPPTNGLMRQKSMLLLGKLLRTKEPEIEQETDKKKVSNFYHHILFYLPKYLCIMQCVIYLTLRSMLNSM